MIADEKLDIAIRIWVKEVFVEKKRRPVPPQITEILKREAAKEYLPTRLLCRIEDIGKRPANGGDERNHECVE